MGGRGLGRTFLTSPPLHVCQFDMYALNGKQNLSRLQPNAEELVRIRIWGAGRS